MGIGEVGQQPTQHVNLCLLLINKAFSHLFKTLVKMAQLLAVHDSPQQLHPCHLPKGKSVNFVYLGCLFYKGGSFRRGATVGNLHHCLATVFNEIVGITGFDCQVHTVLSPFGHHLGHVLPFLEELQVLA